MPAEPRRPAFPSTRWSRILATGGGRDLDGLARSYGAAIEAFLGARLRCGADEARDAAQDAFAWLIENGLLDRADPSRGRFRGFLKKTLSNFAIDRMRRQQAEKRGGGRAHAPLADADDVADPRARTAEQALDDAWRRELLQRAQARLRDELCAGGRERHWRVFRDYFLADGEQPTHAQIATEHDITRTDVSNWLDHGKRRYRALLRDCVAETVATDTELEEELAWLFGTAKHEPRRSPR